MTRAPEPARILIVDDQWENLLALESLLADSRHIIVKASSGREALKALLDQEFAIVLMDVNMPVMSGFDTAALIRERPSTKHVPIIFLTAVLSEDAQTMKAYSLGAVDFLTKPFVPEILRSKVSVFVDLYNKTQEIKHQSELICEIEQQKMQETNERLGSEQKRIKEELLRKDMERQLLEERSHQLQQADRLKDEFLANMSHEIRTPMSGIIGMIEILLDTQLSPQQVEYAQIVRDSAQALLIILNDILDLSKIQFGKVDLESVECPLIPLVEGTARLLLESAHAKGLTIMTFVDPDLPASVKGDPGRLRQVLLNLVSNAIKFTDRGEVIVSAKMIDCCEATNTFNIEFCIADTGVGVSATELGKIFKPFSQADSSTTRRFGGTGLGLSISKRLVDLMGGEIGVQSEGGKGSTFWFKIALEKYPSTTSKPMVPAGLDNTKILIVSSQVSVITILSRYVCSWNMHCDGATTGSEALAMLRSQAEQGCSYDLVIVDLPTAEIEPSPLLDAIRSDKTLRHLKLLLCSPPCVRKPDQTDTQHSISAYLTKPVQQSHLLESIARVMQDNSACGRPGQITTRQSDNGHDAAPADATILVAEDNPVNQKLTGIQLDRLGLRSVMVVNGKEAVAAALSGAYALILMDCQMPEMDGLEATLEIRKSETITGTHVPIIGLTAHAMEKDKERCIAVGMDDYISKPASLEQLSSTMSRWLNNNNNNNNNHPAFMSHEPESSKTFNTGKDQILEFPL